MSNFGRLIKFLGFGKTDWAERREEEERMKDKALSKFSVRKIYPEELRYHKPSDMKVGDVYYIWSHKVYLSVQNKIAFINLCTKTHKERHPNFSRIELLDSGFECDAINIREFSILDEDTADYSKLVQVELVSREQW